MRAEDFDEILSFGAYSSSQNGAFKPHASLNAQTNGSLSVKAAELKLLPAGGQSSVGSGGCSSNASALICVRLIAAVLGCLLATSLPLCLCCWL